MSQEYYNYVNREDCLCYSCVYNGTCKMRCHEYCDGYLSQLDYTDTSRGGWGEMSYNKYKNRRDSSEGE